MILTSLLEKRVERKTHQIENPAPFEVVHFDSLVRHQLYQVGVQTDIEQRRRISFVQSGVTFILRIGAGSQHRGEATAAAAQTPTVGAAAAAYAHSVHETAETNLSAARTFHRIGADSHGAAGTTDFQSGHGHRYFYLSINV